MNCPLTSHLATVVKSADRDAIEKLKPHIYTCKPCQDELKRLAAEPESGGLMDGLKTLGLIAGAAVLFAFSNAIWNNIWRAKSEMGGEDSVPWWRVKVRRENEEKRRR